jgi:hypothetical protein
MHVLLGFIEIKYYQYIEISQGYISFTFDKVLYYSKGYMCVCL